MKSTQVHATSNSRAKPHGGRTTVLVLQGGGALGAYQAGAFAAMAAASRQPDWIAGISIGAINAALITGNAPGKRVEALRTFWERLSGSVPMLPWSSVDGPLRSWANDFAAAWSAVVGLPGFFLPRPQLPFVASADTSAGSADSPSYYDTSPLRATLEELVDFDRINRGDTRLSVGAVDVESGNFVYFDSTQMPLRPEHVMASGALPPGFPAQAIDGRWYWDGGLVSNTPLRHVVESSPQQDATIFQVDLFSARGELPRTIADVNEREKEIRFSSRTRAVTDMMRERHEHHRRLQALAAMLPADRRADPQVQRWLAEAAQVSFTLVHLIYRGKRSETETKDYEFSRASMLDHWRAGEHDMARAQHGLAVERAATAGEFQVFDFGMQDEAAPRRRAAR